MTMFLRERRVAADAASLRNRFGESAVAEARKRIDAEVARISLSGINHWTSVWFSLMRTAGAQPAMAA